MAENIILSGSDFANLVRGKTIEKSAFGETPHMRRLLRISLENFGFSIMRNFIDEAESDKRVEIEEQEG